MGVIIEAIERQVGEFIRDRGLVLWFDPDRHYESIAHGLKAGQDRVLSFDGSFYKLRLEAEPFLRGSDAPKLLVYLPVVWEDAKEPLAEMLALGVDLRPGAPGSRNTRLAVVARKALKGNVPDALLEDLDRQIDILKVTLAELEERVVGGELRPLPTALVVIFGTDLINEAALIFLAHPERDDELVARNALADWATAASTHYGVAADAGTSPADLRKMLAQQVLTNELLEALGDDLPEAFQRLVSSTRPAVARRSAELAHEWRNRRDLAASYPALAAEVATTLHLDAIDFSDAALERAETFLSLEQRLLRRVAAKLIADPAATQIAEVRRTGFWVEQNTELQAEWSLVLQAGQLLRRAAEIEKALKVRQLTWPEIVERYTGEANWADLDTLQRRLERRASSLEFAFATPSEEVEQLVNAVRQRYRDVAGAMAEQFVRAWQSEGFAVRGYVRQTEVFERYVAPGLADRRTAYILVDALRWELARELPEVLGGNFDTHIDLAIGTAPSITEVGMAALLPLASTSLDLGGKAKLEVSLHGRLLRNRADRIIYLKEHAGVPVVDLKLEDPRGFRRKLKDLGAGPALIVVTSQEIDQSGEDGSTGARDHMEKVLTHLGLAMRKLAEEGVERFVVAADHGYIYGEDLAESEKIDPPGGKTVLCHRRVWAGQGGAASDSYLLTEASQFGATSELEMAVPWNLAGFRTAGPTSYFHGGLSPQEILLPVITATTKATEAAKGVKKLLWELSLGSAKVTARFLSVRIQARSPGLFVDAWPTVRVEVRAGAETCAIPVSGSYGFQESTGAVALRSLDTDPTVTEVNTVALMLTSKAPSRGTVSVYLVDAATNVDLKKIENVEVSLAI